MFLSDNEWKKEFSQNWNDTPPVVYNAAPSLFMPILLRDSGHNRIAYFQWGLVPHWAKDPAIGNSLINARAETIAEKPSFRGAFKYRRCIVPANGFIEWKKIGRKKIPYFIQHADKSPLSMAGLWEEWTSPDGSPLHTFSIVTVEANVIMKEIHSRMPALLNKDQRELWLSETSEKDTLLSILKPSKAVLSATPISTLVNNPSNNFREILEDYSDIEEMGLF